jgi:hypothetical protein
MSGTISYDLVMDDDMDFVEGTYRVGEGSWQIFIFSKQPVDGPCWRACTWQSGAPGIIVHVPRTFQLNMASVESVLSRALSVGDWERVQGPDSMQLR